MTHINTAAGLRIVPAALLPLPLPAAAAGGGEGPASSSMPICEFVSVACVQKNDCKLPEDIRDCRRYAHNFLCTVGLQALLLQPEDMARLLLHAGLREPLKVSTK